MQYNDMGKTGDSVSRFGLGCMRFPKRELSDGTTVIDQDKVNELILSAWNKGVNYFDTAYLYQGSEKALGMALKPISRSEYYLVSKLPMAKMERNSDPQEFLDISLNDLQTDYIDYYLLHSMQETRWELVKEMKWLSFFEKMKQEGKIKHIGFSFHGGLNLFKEMIDSFSWDMCQIQLNILDIHHQAGLEGMKYAAVRNIPVVVMEPLRGGAIVNHVPEDLKSLFDERKEKEPPYFHALRWLYDMPEIKVVLSGVNSVKQLDEHIEIVGSTLPESYDNHDLIEKMQVEFRKSSNIGCTHCAYCLPCPQGVDIPEVFEFYNGLNMPGYENHCRIQYTRFLSGTGRGADRCTECGKCETLCPQNLDIIDGLKKAHQALYRN